jgi:L-ornithine N5-monooxygenase
MPSSFDKPPTEAIKSNGALPKPLTNGNVPGHGASRGSHLVSTASDELHDLICVGFGPASLAIAVALHDAIENGHLARAPRVLFIEKQSRFAWHAGMLLPGAKMQISFLKDLATLRDPRSYFTFLNFVHQQGRLIDFINLDTFLPARAEYEDYLRWAAEHFGDVVQYDQEAQSVSPVATSTGESVSQFVVKSQDASSGDVSTFRARNVIMAIGGQADIPKFLPQRHAHIIHSSQYAHLVPKLLHQRDAAYRVAVIGAGQSAAEIFNNIQTLYPNSKTYLVMRTEFLKPSDDSPL